ncbi:MAG: dephospho-CoA kinase [Tenuifilum sp.]|uniref:dephospho-CoA kinase n=1 Tax=Tenuifilum sp. TaxID=2760880 RepID=UPI001B74029A|nr:dephospho-CoA kinase [Bacteroidales bacterium]HOK61510.1 dephospho-CoA kinase [Tenuifilum sp.]MBP9028319.1 dephospho-CoA kinase [Bacteroidales bacterium]HOK85187.1 dephospho-CoA kinase [Tenuifilum sp.]HON71070.1 dephospho-CoA kinase [Tenuifilum sp.]
MLLRVGVTGGIGSGKTLVCKILEVLGYPVFYSDLVAKSITDTDPEVMEKVKGLFGNNIYPNGKLNRKKVAELVFANDTLLKELNSIIHPAVARSFEQWCLQNAKSGLVFKESAILFETGIFRELHKTILVTAPEELRIKRVVERDGVTELEVRARMAKQMPEEQKKKLADFIVDNSSNQLVLPQVLGIVQILTSIKNG